MFSRYFLSALLAATLPALSACGGSKTDATPVKTVSDHFPITVGARAVQMQVAALPEELQHGLMFRPKLDQDEGMIFVFTHPQQMGFWMRNTEIPLDIGYFDADGELKEIYPMYPHDERTVASHSHAIQFCLEMNQGWFKERGVKPGDKLDLKALAEALRARDLKPEAAGLR
ncbi:MAG: DUF192 domain-containing protein [Opitutales bacterium]